MAAGDFYILCPDNEVTREIDNKCIQWADDDLIRNRPPLSRWHPDQEFEEAAVRAERPSTSGIIAANSCSPRRRQYHPETMV